VAIFFALDAVPIYAKSIPFIFYFSKTSLKNTLPLSRIFPLLSIKGGFSSFLHIAKTP